MPMLTIPSPISNKSNICEKPCLCLKIITFGKCPLCQCHKNRILAISIASLKERGILKPCGPLGPGVEKLEKLKMFHETRNSYYEFESYPKLYSNFKK